MNKMNNSMQWRTGLLALVFSFIGMSSFAQNSAVTKATNYQKSGKIAQAKEQIDLAVKHEKTMGKAKTWYTKGLVYKSIAESEDEAIRSLSANALAEAVSGYRKAIEIENKDTGITTFSSNQALDQIWSNAINVGFGHYKEDDFKSALGEFQKAMVVKPMDTTAYIYAGAAGQNGEMYDVALKNYKKLVELDYPSEDYVIRILYLERSVNEDPEAALKYLQSVRISTPTAKTSSRKRLIY